MKFLILCFALFVYAEDGLDQHAPEKIASWWKEERHSDIRRPYTAQKVAALRESIHQEYPSSAMAKKAWLMFKKMQKEGSYSHTFGALDPIQVIEMAEHLTSIYVSGWQCSSTASTSNEPGPDFADYPMDTVPNKVEQLFQAQRFHDRKQRENRWRMTAAEREAKPALDYLRPIIADADTGHGGLSAVMKLTKMFIQRGAAGIHLEDQKPGTKKCGHMSGKVLVSTQEHCDRLIAARLQADIMGSDLLIVARTDAEGATLLDTNIDPRDHPFILGTCNIKLPALAEVIRNLGQAEKEEIEAVVADWFKEADLKTYFDAVSENLEGELLRRWKRANTLSHKEAVALAKELGVEIAWDWEIPRTFEGYYQIKGGVEMGIARGIAFAPYADMLWMETAAPFIEEASRFAHGVHQVFPNKFLAYNLSPSFNWDKFGMSDHEIAAYQDQLGALGYVWQFITLAGFHGDALFAKTFAKDFAERKMLAYVENIQRKERDAKVDVLTHQKWSGVELIGAQQDAVTDYRSSTGASGVKSTENQFAK